MSVESFKEIKDMSWSEWRDYLRTLILKGQWDELWRYCLSSFGAWFLSMLGALGIGLQNYSGLTSLPKAISDITKIVLTIPKYGINLLHGVSGVAGFICGGTMNLIMFRDLLDDFLGRFIERKRIVKKKRINPDTGAEEEYEDVEMAIKEKPEFKNNKERAQYWIGIGFFILSGLLYGAMAFALSSAGPAAIFGMIAGILVAGISTIQEMETWLAEWDKPDPNKAADPIGTKGTKIFGMSLTVAEVIVLSALFAAGFVTFLVGVHVPVVIALTVGCAVAVPTGLFTQKTFYKPFLTKFCDGFRERFKKLKSETKAPALGLTFALLNGLVNGMLAYVGMSMLIGVIAGAVGVAVPPLGAVLAVGIVVAIVAATASAILGMEFWIKKMPKKIEATNVTVDLGTDTESKPLRDEGETLSKTNVVAPSNVLDGTSLNSSAAGASDTQSPSIHDVSDGDNSSDIEEPSDILPTTTGLLTAFSHFQPVKKSEAVLAENEVAVKPVNDRIRSRLIHASHFKPADGRATRQSASMKNNIIRSSVA